MIIENSFIMEEEIWKDIEGYEGLYQVSNLGRVKSLARVDAIGHFRKEKILSTYCVRGYLLVTLCKNKKQTHFFVHRLVATAFIPNPDNLPVINHKSENKNENNIENLEWCTHNYNCNYGTRNKRSSKAQLNRIDCSKRVYQYTLDGVFVREWPSAKEIERQLGFANQSINKCCNGKLKQAYGYIWRFKEKGVA